MIKVYTYYRGDINSWNAYFSRLPAEYQSIYHNPEYLFFLEDMGIGKAVCQIFEKKDAFIYFPALLRPLPFETEGYDVISSWYYGGPLSILKNWKSLKPDWIKAMINGRVELNIICEFIRFDPNLRNHVLMNSPFEIKLNRPTVVVNLNKPWEEIARGFSSQNRRNIKSAEKYGLDVHTDPSEAAWGKFAQIYQEEMERKNAPSHLKFGDDFFTMLQKLKGFTLFVIQFDGEIIGGFISAHGAGIAHHYLSAVQYDHWDKRPNNLLFTEVLAYFWRMGYKLFDFQGGRDGVFRFKENFSMLRNDFFTATCIYDQPKFNTLTNHAGNPKNVNFFPPYRIS